MKKILPRRGAGQESMFEMQQIRCKQAKIQILIFGPGGAGSRLVVL